MLRFVIRRQFSTDIKQFPPAKHRHVPTTGKYPKGFVAGAIACGIKKGQADLSLLVSDRPAVASGVFTTNRFQAAPVQFDRQLIQEHRQKGTAGVRCVVANSGCANSITGQQGMVDAQQMSKCGDQLTGAEKSTLIMSTGVIGQRLPMDKIAGGIPKIELSGAHDGWMRAAIGYMTTDTFPKLLSKEVDSNGMRFRLAGITKGAGMIDPRMATLLGTICTDIGITQDLLDKALKHAIGRSFNCITVDGDMSTNDTIVVLANNAANQKMVDREGKEYEMFKEQLAAFMEELAKLVVRDGEGATKFATVEVQGAGTVADARRVANAIAQSSLVKTAIYGKDANWGRILCAVGYSGIEIDTQKVDLLLSSSTGSIELVKGGEPQLPVDEAKAARILDEEDLLVRVSLGMGQETSKVFTCDLSHEYVSINADYRS